VGERIKSCSAASFHKRARLEIPEPLSEALDTVVDQIEHLTLAIKDLDKRIKFLAETKYPETRYLTQVSGVGELTALAFVLTIEDSARFKRSRDVGAYLGLTPRRDQSGQTDKQLPITKQGNTYLRTLLVGCSQYILGPFGKDCDLRRHGERICRSGGKNAKKRASVAVARKLAVLLHRLWASQSEYIPLRKELAKAA
jgi:transposase